MAPANGSTAASQEWFTIREAAEYLSISEPTVYRWMRQGKLSFYKLGDSTRFKRENLEAVAEKHTGEHEAQQYGLKCIACGHAQLVEGRIQSTGKVYFKPKRTKFFTLHESMVNTDARVCPQCGYVQLFADTGKLDKLLKDADRAQSPDQDET